MQKILLALFEDSIAVETIIDHLLEAEFPEETMSLVLSDATIARKIVGDYGVLKGVQVPQLTEKLRNLGITEDDTHYYLEQIGHDAALFALQVDEELVDDAYQLLMEHNAEHVSTINYTS